MTEESVLRWWKEYSEELMDEENKREEDKWRMVRIDMPEMAVDFLTTLFNKVLETERMPEEWRSVNLPTLKNKRINRAVVTTEG